MSGDIHIQSIQAGIVHAGGQGNISTGESGTFNSFADPSAARAELQAMLDALLRVITETRAEAGVRHLAEQARAEADEPQPRTGRLRGLMEAVVAAAGQAGAVAQAALNVLAVISKIPW